jgi:hypothetical protein
MMERQIFVDTLPSLIETKNDSYLFESGPDSLTQQVLRRGLRVVVVGKDGSIYEMDQWAESGTFRLGSQHNLLVKDNQTRAFEAMNVAEQSAFATMAWGEERVLHR